MATTQPDQNIRLTDEQRQQLADLAQKTGKPHTELIDEWLSSVQIPKRPTNVNNETEKSLYDVLSDRGMLGCFDGPSDLATNPKHMEGFGRNGNARSDSD